MWVIKKRAPNLFFILKKFIIIIIILVVVFLITRIVFIKKQIEEDIVLFIVKKIVHLSFVETPFLKRLILRQNSQLIFYPSKSLNMIFCLRLLWGPRKGYISNLCIM